MSQMNDCKSESDAPEDEYICVHDCCEWREVETQQKEYTLASNGKLAECITVDRDDNVPFCGNPKYEYTDDTSYVELVEEVSDEDW